MEGIAMDGTTLGSIPASWGHKEESPRREAAIPLPPQGASNNSAMNASLEAVKPVSQQKNLRMKAARVACGMSQSDLAEAVGVTRQTIGLIEAGGYNPTLNLCRSICKALGVTLNDLFWEE